MSPYHHPLVPFSSQSPRLLLILVCFPVSLSPLVSFFSLSASHPHPCLLSSASRPRLSSVLSFSSHISFAPSASCPHLLSSATSASRPQSFLVQLSQWFLFAKSLQSPVSSQPLFPLRDAHVTVLVCLILTRALLLSALTISGLEPGNTLLPPIL